MKKPVPGRLTRGEYQKLLALNPDAPVYVYNWIGDGVMKIKVGELSFHANTFSWEEKVFDNYFHAYAYAQRIRKRGFKAI